MNSSSCSYFNVEVVDSHKPKWGLNMDKVRNEIQQSCNLFLNFLKLGSIHILDKVTSEFIFWKIYRSLLILTCIPQIIKFLSGTMVILHAIFAKKGQSTTSFTPVFFCDHFLALLLLLNYWTSRLQISNLMNDILTRMTSLFDSADNPVFSQFRIWSRCLILFCLANWITLFVASLIPIITNDDQHSQSLLMTEYWMALPTSYSKPILIILQNFYAIQTACVNMYFSLIAFTCYMLYCCFKQVNITLKSMTEIRLDDLIHTLNVHQQLANAVKLMSAAFSPTLLALVCVKSAQIVTGVNVLKSVIRYDFFNHYCDLAQSIMLFVTAIVIILTITITGGKIYNEVRMSA